MQKLLKHLIEPEIILVLSIAAFIFFFSIVSFLRHDNFRSRRLDLGNMDQTVWNVVNGNGFSLTDPMGTGQQSRLAVHADFLLVLLAPLYLVWSDPKMLLLVQVIVAGLGALPVYWIAHDSLGSKRLGILFANIYLWYPPMGRMMLHDFHAVALTSTFLLFAYWYIEKKRYVYFMIFAILAALGKEQVWLIIAMMGMYIAFWKKSFAIGLSTATISSVVFYMLFWIAIPAVTPAKQHFALSYLSQYGSSLNEIISNMLTQPMSLFSTFLRGDRLYYYYQLLFPLGFLSLLFPFPLIFSLEGLVINSMSSNAHMRSIDYQYASTIFPFVMISGIFGFSTLQKHLRGKISNIIPTIYICACLVSSIYFWGEFPVGKSQWFWHFITSVPERQAMQSIADSIDGKYSVSVTNNIGAHFSQRKYIYNFPINADKADYTVVYLGDTYAWPSGEEQRKVVVDMLQNHAYWLIAQEGNFFAFKKISL